MADTTDPKEQELAEADLHGGASLKGFLDFSSARLQQSEVMEVLLASISLKARRRAS